MALISRGYWQPAETRVNSFYQLGAGTESWSTILRIPYSELTSGTGQPYSVVAFGHLGRFFRGNGGAGIAATVALRFDGANHLPDTQTRILIHDDVGGNVPSLYEDNGTRRAHPFCIVYTIPVWPANTDLLLCATLEWQINAPVLPEFWVDASTALVFDQTLTGLFPNVVRFGASPLPLQFDDLGDSVILTGSTLLTTGRYWVFYSCRVAHRFQGGPYWQWLAKLTDGTNPDVTYGLGGRGQITGINARNTAFAGLVMGNDCFGGWFPMDVTNATTKAQIRGFSHYASTLGQPNAYVTDAALFAIKESVFDDAVSEGIVTIPNGFRRQAWQTYQSLSIDAGADRARYYAIGMSSMFLATQSPIISKSGSNILGINGLPVRRFAFNALNSVAQTVEQHCPSYTSYIADQSPFLVREGDNALQMNSHVNPHVTEASDFTSRFSTIIGFSPTNDGDWTPPTLRTITYTPITLSRELDLASLYEVPFMPSHSVVFDYIPGVESFTTHDGHVIRWPKWSRPRRIMRLEWVMNEPDAVALYVSLANPGQRAVKLPVAFGGEAVILSPNTLRFEQLQGRLVSRVSVVAIESVYFTP